MPETPVPLDVPLKVNPPPERSTALVDELKVPLRDVVLPPMTCTLPEAATAVAWAWSVATNGQRNKEGEDAATWAGTVTVRVPLCPPLPAMVPEKLLVAPAEGVVGVEPDELPPQADSRVPAMSVKNSGNLICFLSTRPKLRCFRESAVRDHDCSWIGACAQQATARIDAHQV